MSLTNSCIVYTVPEISSKPTSQQFNIKSASAIVAFKIKKKYHFPPASKEDALLQQFAFWFIIKWCIQHYISNVFHEQLKERLKRRQARESFQTTFFVLSEDEELVSSFITSRSEKHLVQQIKRSFMSTKNYTDIAVNSVRKVTQIMHRNDVNQSVQKTINHTHTTSQKLTIVSTTPRYGWNESKPLPRNDFLTALRASEPSLLYVFTCRWLVFDQYSQVESCHIAFMETGFDSRTQRLGDPVICTQLYFCGGVSDEQIEKIMKRGFSKEGNVWITSHQGHVT